MRKYIGVKMIEAQPMTRQEYNDYRGWSLPADEDAEDQGYLVCYPDGYVSWSPMKQFKSAYLEIDSDGTKITSNMVDEFRGDVSTSRLDEKTTLVSAECLTGFVQHEISSCVDPANYDEAVGREIGEDRINNTLWLCLGFVLQWGKYGLNKCKK